MHANSTKEQLCAKPLGATVSTSVCIPCSADHNVQLCTILHSLQQKPVKSTWQPNPHSSCGPSADNHIRLCVAKPLFSRSPPIHQCHRNQEIKLWAASHMNVLHGQWLYPLEDDKEHKMQWGHSA
jgi:hypothetical protein